MTDIATLVLAVDATQVEKGETALNNLGASGSKVAQSIKDSMSRVKDAFFTGIAEGMQEAADKAGKSFEQLQEDAKEAAKVLGVKPDLAYEMEIDKARQAFETLKSTGLLTASELNRAKDAMKAKIQGLRAEMGGWGGDWETLGKKAGEAGQKMEAAGMRIAALGTAGMAAVGSTVKAYSEQEAAGAKLKSTMTSVDGLSKNFERVNALAVELGNKLPGNTADFAAMAERLLQLGVSEESVLGGVGKAAANLAVVMKLPYEEAAEVAAKLKEATGTADADMLKFMDTIQRVGHQGVKTTEMMYAFSRSAGGLKQFGIQGEEESRKVAGLYAQMIKLGMSGETVGTSFNSALSQLAKFQFGGLGEKKGLGLEQQLKSLNIELNFFDEKTKEFKGVDNMVAQLAKLKNLNMEDSSKIMNGIFGSGADAQMMSTLAKGGVEGQQKMQSLIANQADMTERVGIQLGTLSAKWEAATGTFQNFLASIGEKIAPELGKLVDWFGEMSAAAQEFVNENPEIAKWLGLTVGAVAGAAVIGGGALLALGATLTAIGPALGAIATGWGAASAFFTNPVVLAIAGVVATAYASWKFGGFLAEQIDLAVQAFTGNEFATLGTAIYDMVQAVTEAPAKASAKLGEWKDFGKGLINSIREGITERLKGPLGIAEKFNEAIAHMKTTIKDWVAIGGDIVQGIINGIKAKTQAMWDEVKALGKGALKSIKDSLGIQSPSKEFFIVGEMAGEGLKYGILSKTADVDKAAKELGDRAIYGTRSRVTAKWLAGTLNDEEQLGKMPTAYSELTEQGQALTNSLRSELEVAMDKFAEYDKLLAGGAITLETYAKAVAKVHNSLDTGDDVAATSKMSKVDRNASIATKYAAGQSISELAKEYQLSEQWIGKLVEKTHEADTAYVKLRGTLENTFEAVEKSIGKLISTGKVDFKSLADTVRDEFRKMTESMVSDLASSALKNLMTPARNLFTQFLTSFKFADGGVMTSSGSMPLAKYASGGVANSPQLAVFGEGSTAEAFVPLPDGRSIPVSMQNKGSEWVKITVNLIESPGDPNAGKVTQRTGGNGEQFLDIIVDKVRGAMMRDVRNGEGIAQSFENRYALNPAAGAWR